MYEAVFRAAPQDAAGATAWLTQWKPIIDVGPQPIPPAPPAPVVPPRGH